ncbi:hypothetical protein LBMAG53_23360 [Planctomycetota bacterium]|nr:hypothetical protein LBMAG53_23360 [Planctomycetota bacterium]
MALADLVAEFRRLRDLGRRALDQASGSWVNQVIANDHNSIAANVRHLNGVLRDRLGEFLISDGENPWRNREEEFARHVTTRQEVLRLWDEGWAVAEATLSKLREADLDLPVRFRGQAQPAGRTLLQVLTHVAYHVGQIVVLVRIQPDLAWRPVTNQQSASAFAVR